MKNVIEYFYNIEINNTTIIDNKLYFEHKNEKYIFEEIDKSKINIILLTQNYNNFHKIIRNKFNEITSKYIDKDYMLLKIIVKENKKIFFEELIDILFTNRVGAEYIEEDNDKWNKKINQMCNYISNKDNLLYREYYDYYIGLSDNAYNYSKNINYKNCLYGLTYKRIEEDYTLYDIYDPCNIIIGPIIKGISTYLKSCFFKNKEINIEKLIEKINYDDSILLISNILFPTYFYDVFKYKKQEELEKYISNSSSYEKYILNIINEIKKKYQNISSIPWLNQL